MESTYQQKKISEGHPCSNCGETYDAAMIAAWPAAWQEELRRQEDGISGPFTCPACHEIVYPSSAA
jgi:hypothetical protein